MIFRNRAEKIYAALIVLIAGFFCLGLLRDQSHNLPHRPLSEIDIQGHQPVWTVPNTACPAQYPYAIEGPHPHILYCWGKR